jgi:branched-chain amino acid transport system substrate-binding protein
MTPTFRKAKALIHAPGALLAGALVLGAMFFVWWAFADDGLSSPDVREASPLQPANSSPPASVTPSEHKPAKEIVAGMSAPFTGASRALGIELYRGSMAYFAQVNSKGGVHGRQIAIKAYDDGYNPIPAIDNTVRLIDHDNVFLLFNYVGTPTTTRCLPLLKWRSKQSVLLFCPFTGAQPQRQLPYSDFVFNLRPSYYQETGGLVDHFVEIGRKRVAVFYQIDAYGRNGWEGVRLGLARHDLTMVAEATYRRGTTFKESLARQVDILRKADADAVISIGSYAACAAFIRDAREAGWNVPIANISFVGSENLLTLLQEASKANGNDYTRDLINSQVVPNYNDESLPAVREYRQLMERYKPLPPSDLLNEEYQPAPNSFVSLEGFLNAKLLVAVLNKMGPPFDRKRLKQMAQSIDSFDLGIGESVSFAHDNQALERVYYTVARNGRFESLTDWTKWNK